MLLSATDDGRIDGLIIRSSHNKEIYVKATEKQLRGISLDVRAKLKALPAERIAPLLKEKVNVNGFMRVRLPDWLLIGLASLNGLRDDVHIEIAHMDNENGRELYLHEDADVFGIVLTRPHFPGPVHAEMYQRGTFGDVWFPLRERDEDKHLFFIPAGTPHGFRAPDKGLLYILLVQSPIFTSTKRLGKFPASTPQIAEAATT